MRKTRIGYVLFVLGILVCLWGALIMVAGEPLFGESHSGIATVIGIVGIGFIGTSGGLISGSLAREERRS